MIRFFAERLRDVEIVKEVRFTYEVHGVAGWVRTKGPCLDFRSGEPVHEASVICWDFRRSRSLNFV